MPAPTPDTPESGTSLVLMTGTVLAVALALVLGAVFAIAGLAWLGGLAGLAGGAGFAVWAAGRATETALTLSHARPSTADEHARYHNMVEGLCAAAGVPKPRLFVVDDPALNAMTAGRNAREAAIVCTTGMLANLSRIELEGVLAYELARIRSRDIEAATVAVTTALGPAVLAEWGLRTRAWGGMDHAAETAPEAPGALGLLAGPAAAIGSALAPLGISAVRRLVRARPDLLADSSAVALTRYPPGLISALEKVRDVTPGVHSFAAATAHLWLAPPVPVGEDGPRARLARQADLHPPLDERIQALREL